MSRLFNALGDFLRLGSAVVGAYPFTVTAWCRSNDLTVGQIPWCIVEPDGAGFIALDFGGSSGGDPIFAEIDGGFAQTSSGYSSGVWHHVAGVFTNSTSRDVFIDGASKGSGATSAPFPGSLTRTSIGRYDINGSPSLAFDGDVAHVAVWDAALPDSQIASLGIGKASPLRVRRDSLIAYWPVGGQSDEPDIVGGLNMTVNGTPTQSEEPPIPWSVVAPG